MTFQAGFTLTQAMHMPRNTIDFYLRPFLALRIINSQYANIIVTCRYERTEREARECDDLQYLRITVLILSLQLFFAYINIIRFFIHLQFFSKHQNEVSLGSVCCIKVFPFQLRGKVSSNLLLWIHDAASVQHGRHLRRNGPSFGKTLDVVLFTL